jgi:hypothetical protein
MSTGVEQYAFPVFGTQGGGLVRWVNGQYEFVEVPDWITGAKVGDPMPEEWGVIPANNSAQRQVEQDWWNE